MIQLYIVFAIALAGGLASPIEDKNSPRFIQFPDDDGVLHWIDLEAKEEDLPPHRFDPEQDIKYFMYNRENSETPAEFFKDDLESLLATKFDPSKPVKISIHGWTGDGESPNNIEIADAFLKFMDCSVIVIDWNAGASADYIRAVRYVPMVGAKVGELMDWLNTLGVPFTDFHVLGHSLGGHIAGISGRSATRGVVEYITGLDPAFPLWGSDSQRIRPSDAKYVEIIHTNGNQLGLMEPVGHTDFYPNGGVKMPGCGIDIRCSHNRSYLYIADSIDHKGFMADKCDNVGEISNGTCSNTGKLHMGGVNIKSGYTGIYSLTTNEEKPYYQG